MLVFEERGKPENPEKNLSEQGREPTINSIQGHIGGEASTLNHSAIPALLHTKSDCGGDVRYKAMICRDMQSSLSKSGCCATSRFGSLSAGTSTNRLFLLMTMAQDYNTKPSTTGSRD